MPVAPLNGPPEHERLNGWKEIASFLGKGVRTVQRWEKEYGLPIRRIGRQGGEIVWAYRSELEHWLQTHAAALPAGDPVAAPAPESAIPAPALPTAPTNSRSLNRRAAASLAISALAIIPVVMWLMSAGSPAAWSVQAGQLIVRDDHGRTVFSKPFPSIRDGSFIADTENRDGGRIILRDLDEDGTIETIFGSPAVDSAPEAGLFVLNADGSERFVVRPQHHVTFGTMVSSGPWRPYHVFVRGVGDELSIFAVFIAPLEFPTVLLELDVNGRVKSEYWSNGYVETVHQVTWRGRPGLFVGATHNDTRGASLAFFENGHARGSAPAEQSKYRCMNCPPGRPTEFIVFPRRALAAAYPGGEGQPTVKDLRVERDGIVHVSIAEGDNLAADVWYTLDATLTNADALVGSGLYAEQARWFAAGRVDHLFGPEDRKGLFPLLRWDEATAAFRPLPPGVIK